MPRLVRISGLAFILALSGAVTPGPLLALVISQVIAWSFRAVWPILIGHALVEIVVLAILAGGTARVLNNPKVRGILAITGGLVLALMAGTMIRQAPTMTLAPNGANGLSFAALVAAGAGVSLANPYFTGWWATVGSGQFAALRIRKRGELLAFFCGHELGDAAWYVFAALAVVGGRAWLTDDMYRSLVTICGIAVGLMAALFILLGIHVWRPGKSDTALRG